MYTLRKKINHTRQTNRNNLFVLGATQLAAFVFLVSPLCFKGMSKSLKGNYFLIGMLASVAQIVMAEHSKKTSAIAREYSKYELQSLANQMTAAKTLDNTIDQISAQEALVEIVEGLPDYKKEHYIAKYKLFGLLTPNKSVPSTEQPVSSTVRIKKSLPVFDRKVEKMLDIEWMNHTFFFTSSVIIGNEGSGKTQLLQFMTANVIAICPDVDLRIYDLHYDWEQKPWFPGMPRDVEESLFITNARDCYNDLLNTFAELKRREAEKDYNAPPIFRVTDEYLGVLDGLSDDEKKEFNNALIQIKTRGRKWAYKIDGEDTGCRIMLGSHSPKAKMTAGLDSMIFAGSNVFYLGDSINDSSTMFPTDFDCKSLSKQLAAAKAMLQQVGLFDPKNPKKDRARAAVVRLPGQEAGIKILPKHDLSVLKYEVYEDEATNNTVDESVVTEPKTQTPGTQKKEKANADKYNGANYLEQILNWFRANKGDVTNEELSLQLKLLIDKDIPPDHEMIEQMRELLTKQMNGEKDDE